jgi:hypothetical protein
LWPVAAPEARQVPAENHVQHSVQAVLYPQWARTPRAKLKA